MRIIEYGGQRAAENPLANFQLIDPIVTELVLGQPQTGVFPGTRILRPITVDNFAFQFTRWGTERLKRYDTERGMRQPIKHAEFAVSTDTGKLRRFSFGTLRDQDEFNNASPSLALREKCASFARTIVEMDMERRRRDLLIATGSYESGHVITIAGGSEWDTASGDSKATIQTAVNLICSKTGLQPEQLKVFLPFDSKEAALADPIFQAGRFYTSGNAKADLSALRDYWGVGDVWTANPIEVTDADAIAKLYGDIAIVYYDGDFADFDKEYGDLVFGTTFRWNKGVASTAFYSDLHTSWFFPWTDYGEPQILTKHAAVLVKNCSAAV